MAHGHAAVITKPFTPWSLSPALWFDASDSTTLTSSSGKLSQWNDKSGNGRNLTQGTSANQPTTGSNTINSLNVVRFNGTSTGMTTSAFMVSATQHVFAIVRPTSFPNSYNSVLSHEKTAVGWTLLVKSTGKLAVYESASGGGNTSYDGTGVATLSANTSYLLEYSWSGTELDGYVNAAIDNTVTKTMTTGTASTTLYFGHSYFASRWWAGDIAEVLIFNAPLTSNGQTAIRNYLNAKWAVY